ncbi:hypothetical protein FVE85_4055 [Porphyridium purpureum]|uniref:Transmembrane protein n=1 Tax=Porphyridium purpureum TaxID=35688 RepID=A0A5J4YT44_PORPP|nr:hypothetical protein FVE85_4055 [Porphyridium purpureum]|eukprot:POR2458..scf229_5
MDKAEEAVVDNSEDGTAASARTPVKKTLQYRRKQLSWADLSETEKEVVISCGQNAALRGMFGLTAGLTGLLAALAVRGKPVSQYSLKTRFMAVALFTFGGTYIGAISSMPQCARTLAALPDSMLGTSITVAIGEWNTTKMREAYSKQKALVQDRETQIALNEAARKQQIEADAQSWVPDAPREK